MPKKLTTTLICLILFVALAFPAAAFAQDIGNGMAIGVTIGDKNVKNGDIITSTNNGYRLATKAYDPYLFGIASLTPALYLADEANPNDIPVITLGKVRVRVSNKNGEIKKGDFITSSETPGVGQKALENGSIIGMAEEGYTEKDPKKIGLVYVTLNPHFAQISSSISRNLFRAAELGATAAFQTPLGAFRYVISGIIVLLSFYFGFRFFGRVSGSGVEAMGRNPLAGKLIMLSVVINTAITIFVMLFGVAIAYFILVL